MKKFLATASALAISAGTTGGVLNQEFNITSKVQSQHNVEAATSLKSIITITNLGNIAIAGVIPTKAELLTAIQTANKGGSASLTVNDFIFQDIPTTTSVAIIGIGNYSGVVFLQYTKQLTNLNTIITNSSLEDIAFTNGVSPSKADVLKGIQAVNTNASGLTVDDFVFTDSPSATTATIMGVTNYQGTITLTYSQTDSRVDITTLIETTALGTISTGGSTPTKEQLLTAVIQANPNANVLTSNDIGLLDTPTTTSATIYAISDGYKGNVALTYTVE